MPNFKEHSIALEKLQDAQNAEHDNREMSREAHLFITKRDGQWSPYWWDIQTGRPRYTFDMTSPVVDQIAGEMDQADFVINVDPTGGDSTKETAKVAAGIIRNIENISNAGHVYNAAGRSMVTGGIDGWRIVTKHLDDDSFLQDLVVEKVSDFTNKVWFDPGSENQDRSDAEYCFVLQALTKDDYDDMFPDGSGSSVGDDREANAYFHKAEQITVGEILFKKQKTREIVLLTNGMVLEVNDDYEKVIDELEQVGITEKQRRKQKHNIVMSRKFDGSDWLEEEKETVFKWIPVIPTYGNFNVLENKVVYHGAVEKMRDFQMVFNYAKSREIEEIALSPRAKYWMTNKQMSGFADTLATMNTNADPVQGYNFDEAAPGPPQQQGGAQVNPGLVTMAQSMQDGMARAAGLFAASMGESVNQQSGVAIKALQNKGNTGTIKYFKAQEIAICHTAKILMDAIPKVYDTERQVRILGEDGQTSVITLNQQVLDDETGELVTINDLSQGKYDVSCTSGPAFQSKQQEAVAAIIEMAQVDPTIIETGGDILFSSVNAPGMSELGERKRQQLFQNGLIPDTQLTPEEQEILQAQQEAAEQEPPQPDPAQMIAEAELLRAQVEQQSAEVDVQEKSANIQLKQQEQERKDTETQAKIENQQLATQLLAQKAEIEAQKADTDAQKAENAQVMSVIQRQQQQQMQDAQERKMINEQIKMMAETMKIIRESMGIDVFTGPHAQEAFINEAVAVTDAQERAGFDTSIGEDVTGS